MRQYIAQPRQHTRYTRVILCILLLALLVGAGLGLARLGEATPPGPEQIPQVALDKSVDRLQASVGERLTYTVALTNVGVMTASLRITDANPDPPYTRILTDTLVGAVWISHTDVISWEGVLLPSEAHSLTFNLLIQDCPADNLVTNRAYVSDMDHPGTLPIANDWTNTSITCSQYLPLLYRGYCARLGEPSSFGLEIAALHEFHRSAAEQALVEQQYPSLVEALDDSGADWVRLRILWSELEPQNTTPENYARWAYYDDKLSRAAGTGSGLIVTIADNPSWAATTRCGPIDIAPLSEFTEMLAAVVQRYSAPPYNVHHWELYNEPDGTWKNAGGGGLGCWGNDADEYVQLLAQAYPVIKANDPQGQVLLGGIAYDWFTEYGGPFNRYFIDNVLQAGGGDYFDLMNFHYFPDFHCEWDEQYGYQYGRDIIAKANYIRERLGMYGVQKPVVCTELAEHGYTTDPPGWRYPVSSLQMQARYVVQGNVRGMSNGLPLIIWYALDTPSYDSYEQGLLFDDLSAKQAYTAYQVLNLELAGATYLYPFAHSNPDVEGYVFALPCDRPDKTVLWTNLRPDPPQADPCLPDTQMVDTTAQVSFSVGAELLVVDWDGSSRTISDGASGDLDGSVNGQVLIAITGDPAYVVADPR